MGGEKGFHGLHQGPDLIDENKKEIKRVLFTLCEICQRSNYCREKNGGTRQTKGRSV